MNYRKATKSDLSFIAKVYEANIEFLHGALRDKQTWLLLLNKDSSDYYIVYEECDKAWFRIDNEIDYELGMLQVSPEYKRKGIGKYIMDIFETIAKEKGRKEVIIHTTEDNLPAQKLYEKCGYILSEVSLCTTADGKQRTGYTYTKKLL